MCVRWVSQSLTNHHKTVRKEVCSDLLSHYKTDGKSFLSRIVTGDKTWIHHLESQTKRQSVEWHYPTSPQNKTFKATPSAGKVTDNAFWDAKGVILVDMTSHGQTINSYLYI
jgi:hypothetical protein